MEGSVVFKFLNQILIEIEYFIIICIDQLDPLLSTGYSNRTIIDSIVSIKIESHPVINFCQIDMSHCAAELSQNK